LGVPAGRFVDFFILAVTGIWFAFLLLLIS
jgi:hypothetical protein